MSQFFKRFLPDPDRLANTWGLRWLGPALKHPRLWHFSRRGIAVGLGLGIFFGLPFRPLLPCCCGPMCRPPWPAPW